MFSAALARRAAEGKPIRVGIIGAGKFGGGLLVQLAQMKGMAACAVADRDLERARMALLASGVPADAIVLETRARSTYETVMNTKQFVDTQQWRSILLVSSPYHMRRVDLIVRRHAPDVVMIPAPVDSPAFYAHTWGASLRQVRGLLHEYAGILYYRLKGWL